VATDRLREGLGGSPGAKRVEQLGIGHQEVYGRSPKKSDTEKFATSHITHHRSQIADHILVEGGVPPTPHIRVRTLCEVAADRRRRGERVSPRSFRVRCQSGASTPLSKPFEASHRPVTSHRRRKHPGIHSPSPRLCGSFALLRGWL
jgi:hypothetical protein